MKSFIYAVPYIHAINSVQKHLKYNVKVAGKLDVKYDLKTGIMQRIVASYY